MVNVVLNCNMTVRNIVLYLFLSSIILLLFVLYWRQFSNSEPDNSLHTYHVLPKDSTKHLKQCKEGYFYSQVRNSCLPCENGLFSFKSWIGCYPWLDCIDIEMHVRTRGLLSTASHTNAVKSVYLADWHGYLVVYMKCASVTYWDDCHHNTRMVKGFQGSELIVQLLGICEERQEVALCTTLKPSICFFCIRQVGMGCNPTSTLRVLIIKGMSFPKIL